MEIENSDCMSYFELDPRDHCDGSCGLRRRLSEGHAPYPGCSCARDGELRSPPPEAQGPI